MTPHRDWQRGGMIHDVGAVREPPLRNRARRAPTNPMPNPWPLVQLGELLTRSDDWISIKPDERYRQVTVKLWGQGVVQRNEVAGAEIAARQRLRVRGQQFILSRIDARNGALGLVPDSLDGGVVSSDFPVFTPNHARILSQFLNWMSKTAGFVDLCKAASEGTTNRVRLKEDKFLAFNIPLPPLGEQRRIVARIEQLAAKIQEARGHREQSINETEELPPLQAERTFEALSRRHPERNFASFGPHITSGPRNWGPRHAESGLRFYRAQDIGPDSNLVGTSKMFIVPPNETQGANAKLMPGDLMIVITGATVGRCAVFPAETEPGFVNQHVALCRLPATEVFPHYALWGLRAPSGRGQLLGQRYGQGKPGLNLSNIRAITLPFPPLREQHRIVADLEDLQAKVDALKKLQAETAAELDALLPSVLDMALKGEL